MGTRLVLLACLLVSMGTARGKPLSEGKTEPADRKGKNLAWLDYIQPGYDQYEPDSSDYVSMAIEEDEHGRTVPSRKRLRPRPAQPFNSPIYYIRLPPQPYMFVPGLGYVSQPAPSPVSQFVNLPISFVSNGKPNSIYQWAGALDSPFAAPPPKPLKNSNIHRLPGEFPFNGKPEDIFVLRDSYNSLYGEALQNFYP